MPFARIDSNNVVYAIHAENIEGAIACGEGVAPGMVYLDGVFQPPAPPPVPEPTVTYPKVSPIEFKLLFTPQERVAIKVARQTDPVIDDFYDIVEDPRLTHVDLGLASTQSALDYLTAQGLLAEGRKAEILQGAVQ